jgi:hypothetical protein
LTRLAGVSRTRGNGSREASGGARGRARAATPARRASDGARYALRGERPARDAPEECGAEAAGERDQTCRETRREPRVSRRFFDWSSCDRQDPHLPGGNGHVCPLKMKNAVGWRPPFPSITTTEASLSARGSHKTRARGGGGARREPERASLPSALRESDPVAGAARLDPRDALFRPARPREISRPLPRGNDVRHPVSAMASAPQHLGAYRNLTDKFVRYRERARQTFGLGGASSPRAREAASTRLLEAAIGSSSSMGLGGEEGAGLDGLSASLPPRGSTSATRRRATSRASRRR